MIKFSTKARYGTRLMIDLAVHYRSGPIPLAAIAKRQELSVKYLERLIPLLKAAKLVRGIRGLHGGLLLAKSSKEINLREIVEALEGKIAVVGCVGNPSICRQSSSCLAIGLWRMITQVLSQTLSTITLEELAKGMQLPKNVIAVVR